MKEFPNPDNNEYLTKYNKLSKKGYDPDSPYYKMKNIWKNQGMTLHHILPRSVYPEYTDDKENHTFLSYEDHANAHYYLWKGTQDPKYAMAFWFIYIYGRKNRNYTIPEDDDKLLHEDVHIFMVNKRQQKKGGDANGI